jgi:hypothetical protein
MLIYSTDRLHLLNPIRWLYPGGVVMGCALGKIINLTCINTVGHDLCPAKCLQVLGLIAQTIAPPGVSARIAYRYGFIILTIPGLLNHLAYGPWIMLMPNPVHYTKADHILANLALIACLKVQIKRQAQDGFTNHLAVAMA